MKSKYKLKIKEISMRLKSSLFLLLGVICLLALGQMVQAEPWTDPTCAAPGCNTDGPIWVNPNSPQDSSATSTDPMIYIMDSRTSGPAATAYVESDLDGSAAIYGYSTGDTATSYGGYFSAAADTAPGLRVDNGVFYYPIGDGNTGTNDDPSYNPTGLLYYSNDYGTYRYYDGSDWYNLPLWAKSSDSIYYSLSAGSGKGVGIKNGDLTAANVDYTLDVYRKISTSAVPDLYDERAVYGRLASYSSDANYASGALGAYTSVGQMVGVRGSTSETGAVTNYGGYFIASGSFGVGVQGSADAVSGATNYGVVGISAGNNGGIGVYGNATATGAFTTYGVQGTTASNLGAGVYGNATATGAIANQGVKGTASGDLGYGVDGASSGSSGIGVRGVGTATGAVTNYGGYFSAAGDSGRGVYGTSSGSSGYGVYGSASATGAITNYGGYFTAAGNSGTGVYAAGPSTPTATAYAAKFDNGAIAMEELGTNPTWNTNYGMLYVKTDGKLWFTDSFDGSSYDLTAGGSGTIADGTATGQMTFWNNTAGEWQNTETTEMVWDDSNKRLGVGVAVPSYKVHSVTSGATDRAIYGIASGSSGSYGVYGENSGLAGTGVYGTATDTSNPNYGGYFTSAGWAGYGVRGSATNAGATTNYGGYFSASGTSGVGVYGTSSNYGGRFNSTGSTGTGVYSTVVSGSASGTSYAGRFETDTTSGRAVYGYVTGSGSPYGGYFYVNSSPNTGSAVYGYNASNSSATAYAGHFVIASGTGTAVRAENTSATGYAGYFDGRVYTSSKFLAPTIDSATSPSFTWYADDNTGLFRVSGGDTIGFTTNGSEKMRIDTNGSVGIGATSLTSTYKLQVDNSGTIGGERAIYGNASGTTSSNYGGYFVAAGTSASTSAVYGNASGATGATYGGYFTSSSSTGTGVYAAGPATPTVGAYAAKFDNGAIAMEELATLPTWNSSYGMLYVKSSDGKIYFKDSDIGTEYDLTGGAGAATGDNGTAAGQMNFWDGSKWTYTETSEMVWDDTNKNVGIGVASPTSTNRLEVSNTGTTTLSAAVYATATSGGAAIRNYGGYFSADGTIARGVEGRATATGAYTNYGGYFVASGDTGYGVYALANSTTGWAGYFDGRAGVGQDLYVGQAGGTDDDYVYFDAGGEYIKYNNASGYFDFSTNSITVGGGLSTDNDYIRFDDGVNEYLLWDNTNSRFELSDDLVIPTVKAGSTGTAAAPVFTWSGDPNTGIYSSGADTFNITTGGTLAMTVGSTGNVTVVGNINAIGSGGAVYGNATGSFGLYSNRIGSDGNLLRFDRDGANVGLITVASGTITYGTFTGSHYVLLENDNIERGQLIHLTGNNSYKGENNTGEMIYGAKISEMANDPAIIGSYFSVVEDGDGLSWAQAVGNGDMWVVDNGSNLEIGDYLISSDVPGHAMKVTDEYPVAYVVARVAENVDWSKVEEKTEDGIKHKKISVFFESFILNQDLGLAFDKNQNLYDLSWFYAMEAKTPVEKAIQTQKQQLDALETKVEMIEKDGCSNNEAILMETIEKLEARIEALEGQSVEPVKTSFWSKLW